VTNQRKEHVENNEKYIEWITLSQCHQIY